METMDQKPQDNLDFFEDLTGDITRVESEPIAPIGDRIKRIRQAKGVSLDELSSLTGFDVDFLSDIELAEIQPQLGTVMKLSQALDSAFSDVLFGQGEKNFCVTRKEDRRIVARSMTQKGDKQAYTYQSLAADVRGRHMEALMVTLEEDAEAQMSVHGGEEFIFVLQGVVLAKIGKDREELSPGDSIYYLSETPHVLSAKDGKAVVLAVLYEG